MEVRGLLSPRAHLLRSDRPPEQGLGRQEQSVGRGGMQRLGFPSLPWLAVESLMGRPWRRGSSALWGCEGSGSLAIAAEAGPTPPQAGPTWCVPSTSLRCSLLTCSPWNPSCCSTCLMIASTRSAAPAVPHARLLPPQPFLGPSPALSSPSVI